MDKIDPKTIISYKALGVSLEDLNFTKEQRTVILKKITKRLIKDSGINSFPRDFPDFKNYLMEAVIKPFREELAKKQPLKMEDKKSSIYSQLNFLKKMTFIDAVLPLKEFQRLVYVIRNEFGIQPKKLLNKLGFSKQQLERTSSSAKAWQVNAVLRKLGEMNEIQDRQQLIKRKSEFEQRFFLKYINKKRDSIPKKYLSFPKLKKKQLWIPKVQQTHVRNFILYGIATGNLFSLQGSDKSQNREWERRILRDSDRKDYIPFLRYYIYYYYRVCKQEKSIKKTNEKLRKLGLPPTKRREHDSTMKKRYENLFLK